MFLFLARIAQKIALFRVLALAACLFSAALVIISPLAYADNLSMLNLVLTSNTVSQTANYDARFNLSNLSQPLGSIDFEFCSNSALPNDPCVAPAGFNASGASLISQSGETGFTMSSSGANDLILSRSPSIPISTSVEYQFNNITNPSTAGSQYLRITTYTGSNGTGSQIDYGGLAYVINEPANITAQVPPYITFCAGTVIASSDCSNVSGDYVNFGELSSRVAATGSEQFVIATNAANGYNVSVMGVTMTSGNNIIAALSNPRPSTPGTSQFGMNLAANTSPAVGANPSGGGVGFAISSGYNLPNIFKFNSGDTLVASLIPSSFEKFTTSYIVNRSPDQAAGVYSTTLTFIAMGNF